MTDLKDQWDLAMAMEVLNSKTIDAKTWSDAVKWLLLYGPPEIMELLQQASGTAFHEYFPELKPIGYSNKGQPCYDIQLLAAALGISEEEASRKIMQMEAEQGIRHLFNESETNKIQ